MVALPGDTATRSRPPPPLSRSDARSSGTLRAPLRAGTDSPSDDVEVRGVVAGGELDLAGVRGQQRGLAVRAAAVVDGDDAAVGGRVGVAAGAEPVAQRPGQRQPEPPG